MDTGAHSRNLTLCVLYPLVAALLMLAGCSSQAPAAPGATTPPAPKIYSFDASDFSFSNPDSVEAGWVTLQVRNAGKEPHHVQLLRLNDAGQLNRITDALKKDDLSVLRELSAPGGVGAIDPQGNGEVTLNLTEGQYVLACFVPSPDGTAHVAKGMIKPLKVSGSPSAAKEPTAEITVNMKDFAFDFGDTMTAGKHVFKVVNAGPQFHEWNLLKLAQGKTLADVQRFFTEHTPGPPPFQAVGGMNGLSPNLTGYVTLDLQPGQYLAVCNIPDPASGKGHAELGMLKLFTVR